MASTLQPSSSNPKLSLIQKIDKVDQMFAQAAYTTKPKKEPKQRVQQDTRIEKILPPTVPYQEVETKSLLNNEQRSVPKLENGETEISTKSGKQINNEVSPPPTSNPYLVSLVDLSATIAEMKAQDPAHKYRKSSKTNSTATTSSTTTTSSPATTKKKEPRKPITQEEYDVVRRLVREPKNKQYSSSLPGIETLNNNNNGQRTPPRYEAYKRNYRKRHFREKEDIEEANVIQKIMKNNGSKAKKQKDSPDAGAEVVVKQEELDDQYLIPNTAHQPVPEAGPSGAYINNIIPLAQQQQQFIFLQQFQEVYIHRQQQQRELILHQQLQGAQQQLSLQQQPQQQLHQQLIHQQQLNHQQLNHQQQFQQQLHQQLIHQQQPQQQPQQQLNHQQQPQQQLSPQQVDQQQPQQQLSPQQLFQQQQQKSLMETVNSEDWNNHLTFLPKGMDKFTDFFTPEQLQLLQLLNQRHVLEDYKSRATSVEEGNNTSLLKMVQGNVVENHG